MTHLSAWVDEMALVPCEPASRHTNPFPPLSWHNLGHTKTLPEKSWGDAGGEPTRSWWPLIPCSQGPESGCCFCAAQRGSGWWTFRELGREGCQGITPLSASLFLPIFVDLKEENSMLLEEPSCSGCPFRQQIGAHRHWFPSAHHCLGFSCISWTILSCTHPPDPQPAYPVFCLPQRWAELSTFCSLCPPPLGSWRAVRA